MKEEDYIPSSCPFCNMNLYGLTFFEHTPTLFSMKCSFCECIGPIALTKDEAIKKWNRRTK